MRQMLGIREKGLSPLGITWLTFARASVQQHVNMHFSQATISQVSVLIFLFEWFTCIGPAEEEKLPNKSPWSWDILSNSVGALVSA